MFTVIDNNIIMTRGDTGLLYFNLKYSDGTPFEPAQGEKIVFTMKSNMNSAGKPLISREVPLDTMIFEFKHEDTDNCRYGDHYIYDVQLIDQQGHVNTFYKGTITLEQEVGTWKDYQSLHSIN